MADHEVWKSIPGHKGYEVSNLGRVRSLDRWVTYKSGNRVIKYYRNGKILRQMSGGGRWVKGVSLRQYKLWNGYKTTHLGGSHPNKYIHHLVAMAFLGPTPSGMEVCHNNGRKTDNRLENLRFDTQWHNVFDTVKHRYEQAWLNQNAEDTQKRSRPGTLGKGSNR